MIVVDNPKERLAEHLPAGVEVAVQAEPRGTGDAVAAGAALLERDEDGVVLVINGDMPLITGEAIAGMLAAHAAAGAGATLATMELADPTGYGRIVRSAGGGVERVVETKVAGDATAEELAIREVNAGLYAFAAPALREALRCLGADNAQGEVYLPDVVPLMLESGHGVQAHLLADPELALGVNDRVDLATVTALAQQRIHRAHQRAGVTIVDPASTLIEAGVAIGADTVVEPATFLRGATRIGQGSAIGPATTIIDCEIGDGAFVVHSYLQDARVGDGAKVGPFAYLRPGADLREGVEGRAPSSRSRTRRSGAGTKVPHLSYIGDTEVGERSNLGAGTITANYDGFAKHPTTIGSGVRLSVAHLAGGARQRRRRRLHRGRLGHHGGRPARRARHRAGAADQHRGVRGARRGAPRRRALTRRRGRPALRRPRRLHSRAP